jgi:hypothetical protein
MANQIVVSAGAKVRNLSGVLTATSGVVSFLPIDVSLGIPQLDVNGKILVSQLPNSVMEYQGVWNANTNSPTLTNGGAFNQGDVYLCNVAGTTNFGAGPISFIVGDQAIFSSVAEGNIWQKAGGATGTVTSVAVTESGDSLNITGSPITTSGTINIGFNGTNLQYVNGAGNLTTFPILTGYVTAVSGTAPVVSSGGTTPAISMAAATASVDGYLDNADWSTFNAKQNAITLTTTGTSGASTLVGATLNIPNYGSALTGYVPYTGATQDVDLGAFKLNAQSLHIKGTAGNGHLGLKHQSASATASANEVSLFADSLGDLGWLNGNLYLSKFITSGNTAARSYTFPDATCNIPNDSLVVHLAGTETITGAKTFSGYTTFTSTVDITSGLTFSNSGFTLVLQPPTLSVNRTVTLPNGTGTLALTSDISYPVTSVFGRTGAVVATEGDYSLTQLSDVTITSPTTGQVLKYNGTAWVNDTDANSGTVTSVGLSSATSGVTIGSSPVTTSGTITLAIATATTSQNGLLSSTDWTTFNNKQSAITLTTTGTSGAATFSSNTLNIPNYGSALSAYLPLAGGTLTGALGGTSASFINSSVAYAINATSAYTGSASNNAIITFGRAGSAVAGSIGYDDNLGSLYIGTTTGHDFLIKTNNSTRLTIASTGAATFSSSVTAKDYTAKGGYGGSFTFYDTITSVTTGGIMTDAYWVANNQLNTAVVAGAGNSIKFYTNNSGTASAIITSGGNVGIGTSSPDQKLTIQAAGTANGLISFKNSAGTTTNLIGQPNATGDVISTSGTDDLCFRTQNGNMLFALSNIEFARFTPGGSLLIGTTDDGGKLVSYSTTAATQIKAAGTAPAITFSNTVLSPTIGGVLGACTASSQFLSGTASGDMVLANQFSGFRLYVASYSGGVYLTSGATSWTANSDIRLKNINSHIENAVEKLSTLQTINFSYKDDKFKKQNLGLIAQEVEKIFPELIDKNGDGMLGVRYTELVPVLIKAVQELKAEIETLKNK